MYSICSYNFKVRPTPLANTERESVCGGWGVDTHQNPLENHFLDCFLNIFFGLF